MLIPSKQFIHQHLLHTTENGNDEPLEWATAQLLFESARINRTSLSSPLSWTQPSSQSPVHPYRAQVLTKVGDEEGGEKREKAWADAEVGHEWAAAGVGREG